MEGQKKPKPPLVQKLAEQFIAELHLTARDPEGKAWTPRSLYATHEQAVRRVIDDMLPAKLGMVAIKGLNREQARQKNITSFCDVCDEGYDPRLSGRAYLRMIATRTIIAAMFDILRARADGAAVATARAGDGRATLADAKLHRLERDSHVVPLRPVGRGCGGLL